MKQEFNPGSWSYEKLYQMYQKQLGRKVSESEFKYWIYDRLLDVY